MSDRLEEIRRVWNLDESPDVVWLIAEVERLRDCCGLEGSRASTAEQEVERLRGQRDACLKEIDHRAGRLVIMREALEEIEECQCASPTMNGQCTDACKDIARTAFRALEKYARATRGENASSDDGATKTENVT